MSPELLENVGEQRIKWRKLEMVSSMFGRNIVSNSPVKPFELLGFFQQKRPPFLVTVFWRNVLRGVKWWTERGIVFQILCLCCGAAKRNSESWLIAKSILCFIAKC